MAIEYQIDTCCRIAYVKATGETSFFPSVEAIRTLADDTEFRPDYSVLVDLRNVDAIPTISEARAFAKLLSDTRIFGNRMGLVVSEEVNTSINQMAIAISRLQGRRIGKFVDVGEAKAWLDKPKLTKRGATG